MTRNLKTQIEAFSATGGFLKINKRMIDKFGIEKAAFFANIVDALDYFITQKSDLLIDGVWFYQTHQQQMEKTKIGRDRIKNYKDEFIKLGILETKMMRLPAKEHYKINFDKLEEILEQEEDIQISVNQDSQISVGQETQNSAEHIKTKNNQDYEFNNCNHKNDYDSSSSELKDKNNSSNNSSTRQRKRSDQKNNKSSPSEKKKSMGEKARAKAQASAPKKSSKKSSLPKNKPIYKKDNLPDSIEELPFYSESNFNVIRHWNSVLKENGIKAKTLSVNKPTLAISKILFHIEMLKQGKFGENISIPKNGIPEHYYYKKYSLKEIKDVISDFPKMFLEGNWPPNKDWLYRINLETFLYTKSSSFNNNPKSHFINLAYNGIKKIKKTKEKKEDRTDYDDKTEIHPDAEFDVSKTDYDDKTESIHELLENKKTIIR